MQKIRVFINGFGRIGRSAFRVMLEDEAFEIVGINDIFPFTQFQYLLQYDTTYKRLEQTVTLQDDTLFVGEQRVTLFCEEEASNLNLSSLNVDVVLQCSGTSLTVQKNSAYLEQGVKQVILSTPPHDNMATYIMGFSHQNYAGEKIISNSSCSANAMAPVMQVIEEAYGIVDVAVSMIHSYTSDQNLLDGKNSDAALRRSRSATQNILPLESTATTTLGLLFPQLKGKIYTKSIRVPINAMTLYDFTFHVKTRTDKEALNALIREKAEGPLLNIVGTDNRYAVSSDFIKNRHSATIDLPMTEVMDGRCLKITAWQDNEYGYAYQLVAMAKHLHKNKK